MMSARLLAIILSGLLLAGCTVSSSGIGAGVKGSSLWHRTAPEADIREYYAEKTEAFLKTKWDESYSSPATREAIGAELVRRGLDPLKYLDSEADATRRVADEDRRREEAAQRRAAKREKARREAIGNLIDKL